VFEIMVPPLRERSDDILPLARLFLEVAAIAEGVSIPVLSPEAEQLLLGYEWPGNVRELENRAKRAFLVRAGDTVRGEDVGLNTTPNPNLVATISTPPAAPEPTANAPTRDPEYAEIEAALVEARGVVSRAAAQLGISRQALYRRMERLGIELERRPKS